MKTDDKGKVIRRVQDPDVTSIEKVTSVTSKKVTLYSYKMSSDEDPETFFHAWDKLQSELKSVWDDVSSNKTNDARIFNGSLCVVI